MLTQWDHIMGAYIGGGSPQCICTWSILLGFRPLFETNVGGNTFHFSLSVKAKLEAAQEISSSNSKLKAWMQMKLFNHQSIKIF